MSLIAFDLDGTLIDQSAAAHLWATEFVAQWQLPGDEVSRTAFALSERKPKGEVFAALAEAWSLPVTAGDIWYQYRSRMPELVRCTVPDLDALRALRRAGWTIGIVTNGMADNQEGKIRRTGLAELVDGWAISEQVGSRKPDASIFHALAEMLGCALEGWMVGDSLEMDIAGGTAVGLKTAWITDVVQSTPATVPATITAPSVADAASMILSLEE